MKLDSFPEDSQDEMEGSIDLQAAAKFKVVTCLSKSCNEKRKGNMVDPLATFSAMYSRAQESAPSVTVEEQPCLGSCARGPCVAIQHSDYIGNVSLEGMTEIEFSERVFHNVISEQSADRVWNAVTNAIKVMSEEEE